MKLDLKKYKKQYKINISIYCKNNLYRSVKTGKY